MYNAECGSRQAGHVVFYTCNNRYCTVLGRFHIVLGGPHISRLVARFLFWFGDNGGHFIPVVHGEIGLFHLERTVGEEKRHE